MTDPAFDAVLWDIDGTLADSEPLHNLTFTIAARDLGLALPDDFHTILLGKSEDATHAWMVENVGLTISLDAWTARRLAAYMDHLNRVTAFDATMALLGRIGRTPTRQAFVSNSNRPFVEANLRLLGLNHPHAITVSRNDVVRGKPAPEPYLRAAHLLGVDPARIAVVEDSDTGAQAGIDAGMSVFIHGRDIGLPDGARPISDLGALYA